MVRMTVNIARKIPYEDRKGEIRAELLRCAKKGRTIFYADLGAKLGIPTQGPWKPVLDEISHEERAKGVPDITYLAINKRWRVPSQVEFQASNPPTHEQRKIAADIIRKVFAYYRGNIK
jgi:hypothetical protein